LWWFRSVMISFFYLWWVWIAGHVIAYYEQYQFSWQPSAVVLLLWNVIGFINRCSCRLFYCFGDNLCAVVKRQSSICLCLTHRCLRVWSMWVCCVGVYGSNFCAFLNTERQFGSVRFSECKMPMCISAAYAVMRCLCLSRSWTVWKRINISSKFFHYWVATPF